MWLPRGRRVKARDPLETRVWDALSHSVASIRRRGSLQDGGDLTKLELSEAQAAPALGRTHKRAEHELEHRLLAEAVRDDLEPSPLLDEGVQYVVVRVERRCVTGSLRWAMQASKSSSKQATALGSSVP